MHLGHRTGWSSHNGPAAGAVSPVIVCRGYPRPSSNHTVALAANCGLDTQQHVVCLIQVGRPTCYLLGVCAWLTSLCGALQQQLGYCYALLTADYAEQHSAVSLSNACRIGLALLQSLGYCTAVPDGAQQLGMPPCTLGFRACGHPTQQCIGSALRHGRVYTCHCVCLWSGRL